MYSIAYQPNNTVVDVTINTMKTTFLFKFKFTTSLFQNTSLLANNEKLSCPLLLFHTF